MSLSEKTEYYLNEPNVENLLGGIPYFEDKESFLSAIGLDIEAFKNDSEKSLLLIHVPGLSGTGKSTLSEQIKGLSDIPTESFELDLLFKEKDGRRANVTKSFNAFREWFYDREKGKALLKSLFGAGGRHTVQDQFRVHDVYNKTYESISIPRGDKAVFIVNGVDTFDVADALADEEHVQIVHTPVVIDPAVSYLSAMSRCIFKKGKGLAEIRRKTHAWAQEYVYMTTLNLLGIKDHPNNTKILYNTALEEDNLPEILRLLQSNPEVLHCFLEELSTVKESLPNNPKVGNRIVSLMIDSVQSKVTELISDPGKSMNEGVA